MSIAYGQVKPSDVDKLEHSVKTENLGRSNAGARKWRMRLTLVRDAFLRYWQYSSKGFHEITVVAYVESEVLEIQSLSLEITLGLGCP
jgi:hypothetical protein